MYLTHTAKNGALIEDAFVAIRIITLVRTSEFIILICHNNPFHISFFHAITP